MRIYLVFPFVVALFTSANPATGTDHYSQAAQAFDAAGPLAITEIHGMFAEERVVDNVYCVYSAKPTWLGQVTATVKTIMSRILGDYIDFTLDNDILLSKYTLRYQQTSGLFEGNGDGARQDAWLTLKAVRDSEGSDDGAKSAIDILMARVLYNQGTLIYWFSVRQ